MFNLNNKIAIITGASRGIGKEIAKLFSKSGAHVVCVARSQKEIETLSKSINDIGGSSSFQICDVSDED